MKIKNIMSVFFLAVMNISSINITYAETVNIIYVAEYGSDSYGKGTENKPYATLTKAVKAARGMEGKSEIIFREGEFPMESITLSESDNGLSFKAYNGEKVVFTDTHDLLSKNFNNITDKDILKRIKNNAIGKVLEYDLSKNGIDLSGDILFEPYLYINSESKYIARYPNSGYIKAENADGTNILDLGFVPLWENMKEAEIVCSYSTDFFWKHIDIENIEGKSITLSEPVRNNAEFYVENLLEEIDMPGEYYIDRKENKLYYYPDGDIITAEITNNANKIKIENADNIAFDGITFDKTGDTVFKIDNSSNISITNCNFNYIQSGYVIKLSNSKNSDIINNSAYGCDGGLIVYSGGEFKTLTPGNINISYNKIINCGRVVTTINAMIMSGENSYNNSPEIRNNVGNRIEHNIIGDCYGVYAISVPGNNNIVKYNEIYNVGRHINDGGAIYFGRSVVKYGNDVSYNYIHNLNKEKSYAGIYTDDGYSGIDVHHNVIKDTKGSIYTGIGMNSSYENNLLINCQEGILLGERMDWKDVFADGGAFEMELNEVLKDSVSGSVFKSAYNEMENAQGRSPFFAPYNTKVYGNVSIGESDAVLHRARHKYMENGTLLINNEDKVNGISYAIFTLNGVEYVDEIKAYGAVIEDENGNNINAKKEGNPTIAYDDNLFVNPQEGNYSLKKELNNSDVSEIDMTEIGFRHSDIEPIEAGLIYPENNSKNVDNNITLSWGNVEQASYYTVNIYSDNEYTCLIKTENMYKGDDNNNSLDISLEKGQDYYWSVTAYGIAKGQEFSCELGRSCFRTAEANYVETGRVEYALSLLLNEIEAEANGEISYTEEALDILNEKYNQYCDFSNMTEEETVIAQDDILNTLETVKLQRTDNSVKITSCRAVENSSVVIVSGEGLQEGELVSILVTNPRFELSDIKNNFNTETIQYNDTIVGNQNGDFSFEFDTKVNNIDMPGVYRVYISSENGKRLEAVYNYGSIEISEPNISENGRTAWVSITNRLNDDILPNILCAVYTEGKLTGICKNESITLLKNSVSNINFEIYEGDSVKIFVLEGMRNLKPMTIARVKYLKEK